MKSPKSVVVGAFVGGRATRFGGVTKGLLSAPDTSEPLVIRLARICREALPHAEFFLVGRADAYRSLGFPELADDPPGIGPLGGLSALLRAGAGKTANVIALAADLPFLTSDLVGRIAGHAPAAAAVAPKPGGIWQPLCARYSPPLCRDAAERAIARGDHALFRLLDALGDGAVELPIDEHEAPLLSDWDRPEDLAR